MRDNVPETVASALARAVIRSRRPAFVTSDSDGNALRWGGSLRAYGIGELSSGLAVADQIPFLTGLLPLADTPAEWFRMQTEGVFADVHLVPHGAEDWIILLDSTREVRGEASVQQLRNELQLARNGGESDASPAPAAASSVAELYSVLGILALARRPDGSFSVVGTPPDWALALFPLADGVANPSEMSPFLENFLIDADPHWHERRPDRLRSGPWREDTPDGDFIDLEATAIALPRGSLLLVERLGARHRDATETLQKAREARLGHYELLRDLEHKEVLLHTIVHDLSGPATAMQGFLQLVEDVELPPQLRKLSTTAMRQSIRQQEMVGEILDVFAAERRDLSDFRFDAGGAPDLVGCVREAVESMVPVFGKRGVGLRCDVLDQAALRVVGEKSRLDRVLFNLIENALRYSPRGSTVSVGVESARDWVTVCVEDQGEGIDPDLAKTIFEKLSQGRGDKKGKAGLGLYFCRITIERWGGELGCEPMSGGGTRFWFRLRPSDP